MGKPNNIAYLGEAKHGAGIGAGGGYGFTRIQFNIRQEPFVTPDQLSANEGALELHGFDSGLKRWQMSRC
jgi:hypothetical protein